MITPNTDIILYKTPIELDNLNQLKFDNFNSQWAWFSSLPRLFLDDATFQRKDGVIRFPTNDQITYDDLIQYNYCTYKNENYGPKVFFAFIKDIRYINDGMCEIEIKLDAWQTWQNDITIKKSFVEREHVNDDTFGKHTIPEGLETGDYMYQPSNADTDENHGGWDSLVTKSRIVFAMSDPGHTGQGFDPPAGTRLYNGVYSGLRYFIMKDGDSAYYYIQDLMRMSGNKIEGLYAIFMAPEDLLDVDEQTEWDSETVNIDDHIYYYYFHQLAYSDSKKYLQNCFIKDRRICGLNYRPRNNKVLCYPYRYITVTNNAGQTNHYKYEYFKDNNRAGGYYCGFGIDGAISIGCSIKLYPVLYNNPEVAIEGLHRNYMEGLDCYKFPTCGWLTDPFLNWISQNAVNIGLSTAASAAGIIAGVGLLATGAGASVGVASIGAGVSGITSTIAEGYKKSLEPDTAHGGSNQGDLNFSAKLGFTPYCRSIKDEYAKIIDDYFTMFGYKVNSLKVPELHSRLNWNFIKTIDINIIGDIPQSDLQEIKSLFNNGITLWHNPNTFLDYSQSNYII
ncbi:MAG: hypothetical protein IKJ30_00440 [Bacilli bacterium]|nr:hypothetical protein [Bacilli bacterium]